MKVENIILIGLAVWLLTRKKNPVMGLPSVQQAKLDAKEIATEFIDKTDFVPDETTFRDMYKAEQKKCR